MGVIWILYIYGDIIDMYIVYREKNVERFIGYMEVPY